MSRRDVDGEIEKALEVWSEHTDFSFTQKRSGKVHIDIKGVPNGDSPSPCSPLRKLKSI
jgi:hypothetical protein